MQFQSFLAFPSHVRSFSKSRCQYGTGSQIYIYIYILPPLSQRSPIVGPHCRCSTTRNNIWGASSNHRAMPDLMHISALLLLLLEATARAPSSSCEGLQHQRSLCVLGALGLMSSTTLGAPHIFQPKSYHLDS